MTNWTLMVGIFVLPQFLPLFPFYWMLSSRETGSYCIPQTYSKILLTCLYFSLSSACKDPTPMLSVYVLHVIHSPNVFSFGRFCSSISRPHIFFIPSLFVALQLYVYSISNNFMLNTGVSSYELCFSSLPKTEVNVLYLYFSCVSLFFSNEPVQIKM